MPPIAAIAGAVLPAVIGAGAALAPGIIASRAQKKAQKRAEEFAHQQADEARAEQARLEARFNLSPGELASESTYFSRLNERFAKTGEALFTEEGGLAGQQLKAAIEAEEAEAISTGEPTEMFAPELELTREMVNAEANRRGVFGGTPEGGIRFEQLGRAGVDLAIKSARERLAQNAAILARNAAMLGRKAALSGAYNKLSSGARSELDEFLNRKREREYGATMGAADIASKQIGASYDTLQDIWGARAGQAAASGGGDLFGGFGGMDWGTIFRQPSKKKDWFELNKDTQYTTPQLLGSLSGGSPFSYSGGT